MSQPLRGRLAPSPTGALHLGNARSFLLAWLDLRSRGGEVLLRIEDLDGPRVKGGAEAAAIEDLRWLGLDWDGAPVRQSERGELYAAALARLAAQGLAYPCSCTRRDVELAASAPHLGDEGPLYPGTCRGRWTSAAAAEQATGRPPCWRLRVPEPGAAAGQIAFTDRVRGPVRADAGADFGDFVISKSSGSAAYQLAVVVDDARQGVTEILRGDDLLLSAARQLLLYRALELPPPSFAHVPLIVGVDGLRLAKRHGDTSLRQFRAEGCRPEQVVGWLASVSGLRPAGAICSAQELLAGFDLDRLPRSAVVWRGSLTS